jgi:hypothetical protein
MSGEQQAVCREIEIPIPLMLRGVPEEDTLTRMGDKLMGSGGTSGNRHTQRPECGRRREWCRRGQSGVSVLRR